MCRIQLLLLAICFAANSFAANSPADLLRRARSAALTNTDAALKICQEAVTQFPTNAEPLGVRAQILNAARRYDEAIADLSAAIKLEPQSAQLRQGRGEINFRAGHFKESVADFDRVIELEPHQAPYHWQRGISLYYAGRFTDGRKQFELHKTVNANDVENAAWHFLCAAREQGVTNALNIILPVGADSRVPMKEIDALYRGKGSVADVLAAASAVTGDARQQDGMFYAHLYLGLYFDSLGNKAKAREHIEKAAKGFAMPHYMGDVARVHLQTLAAVR